MMKTSKILYRSSVLFFVMTLGSCVGCLVNSSEPGNTVYVQGAGGRVEEHTSLGETNGERIFKWLGFAALVVGIVVGIAAMVVDGNETELAKSQFLDKYKALSLDEMDKEILQLAYLSERTPEDKLRYLWLKELRNKRYISPLN